MAAAKPKCTGGWLGAALVWGGVLGAGAVSAGCGGGPEVVTQDEAPTKTVDGRPNPSVANPCETPAIDPGLNPCAGEPAGAPAAVSQPAPGGEDAPTP